jgi:Coenzyme PQQ synthesis protein D (PqqD)
MTPPDASLAIPPAISIDTDWVEVPSAVVARPVDGLTVLLNAATGRYFSLDAVGTRAWSLMASMSSLHKVQDILLAEFQVAPEHLRSDLSGLVESLEARGLLKVHRG